MSENVYNLGLTGAEIQSRLSVIPSIITTVSSHKNASVSCINLNVSLGFQQNQTGANTYLTLTSYSIPSNMYIGTNIFISNFSNNSPKIVTSGVSFSNGIVSRINFYGMRPNNYNGLNNDGVTVTASVFYLV